MHPVCNSSLVANHVLLFHCSITAHTNVLKLIVLGMWAIDQNSVLFLRCVCLPTQCSIVTYIYETVGKASYQNITRAHDQFFGDNYEDVFGLNALSPNLVLF